MYFCVRWGRLVSFELLTAVTAPLLTLLFVECRPSWHERVRDNLLSACNLPFRTKHSHVAPSKNSWRDQKTTKVAICVILYSAVYNCVQIDSFPNGRLCDFVANYKFATLSVNFIFLHTHTLSGRLLSMC